MTRTRQYSKRMPKLKLAAKLLFLLCLAIDISFHLNDFVFGDKQGANLALVAKDEFWVFPRPLPTANVTAAADSTDALQTVPKQVLQQQAPQQPNVPVVVGSVGNLDQRSVLPAKTSKPIEKAPNPKSSPSHLSFENGGLVLFFHIPKTGGTSIRDEIASMKQEFEFISADNRSGDNGPEVLRAKIDRYMDEFPTLKQSDRRIRFVEFHGVHTTFAALYDTIRSWRERAKGIGMPFFAFSMIRDPIDTQISVFNFFCIQIGRHVKCGVPHTIEGLLQKCPPDPMTRWLCHSSETFTTGEFSCPGLHEQIVDQIDWVGVMERFDRTITVLNEVLSPVTLKGLHKNKPRKNRGGVVRKDLNEDMIERMEQTTKVDDSLYQMVKVRYQSRMVST